MKCGSQEAGRETNSNELENTIITRGKWTKCRMSACEE